MTRKEYYELGHDDGLKNREHKKGSDFWNVTSWVSYCDGYKDGSAAHFYQVSASIKGAPHE